MLDINNNWRYSSSECYGELKRRIPEITHKVLSSQLNELESSGIVNREEYRQTPPKVEYSLTPRGRTVMPILEEMCKWECTINHR
ncbi:winged helix-turn-helix transcriptional regulator [Paenibacillus elgii]|uniref:winged helix-turn-helix transcriptional regulator n=1 Tax=Paenibacillus elgii TaxID=189691 RepID=UPI000FD73EC2|nr:winged helix-turn-helix transcriptional regulator [Paenibacillus elgii]NEN86395.1 winged helix-turn-helix transcriptional regulator [Paenibacillus elgii]